MKSAACTILFFFYILSMPLFGQSDDGGGPTSGGTPLTPVCSGCLAFDSPRDSSIVLGGGGYFAAIETETSTVSVGGICSWAGNPYGACYQTECTFETTVEVNVYPLGSPGDTAPGCSLVDLETTLKVFGDDGATEVEINSKPFSGSSWSSCEIELADTLSCGATLKLDMGMSVIGGVRATQSCPDLPPNDIANGMEVVLYPGDDEYGERQELDGEVELECTSCVTQYF